MSATSTDTNTYVRRIYRDLLQVTEQGPAMGIEAWLADENKDPCTVSAAVRVSAAGSVYAGGTFELVLENLENFPFYAPRVCFTTPCYHPLVHPVNGSIAWRLDDDWGPAWTLYTLLLTVQNMLTSVGDLLPTADIDGQDEIVFNEEAFKLYWKNRTVFVQRARHWTEAFAIPVTVYRIQRVLGTGKSDDDVLQVLRSCQWDVVQAVVVLVADMMEVEENANDKHVDSNPPQQQQQQQVKEDKSTLASAQTQFHHLSIEDSKSPSTCILSQSFRENDKAEDSSSESSYVILDQGMPSLADTLQHGALGDSNIDNGNDNDSSSSSMSSFVQIS